MGLRFLDYLLLDTLATFEHLERKKYNNRVIMVLVKIISLCTSYVLGIYVGPLSLNCTIMMNPSASRAVLNCTEYPPGVTDGVCLVPGVNTVTPFDCEYSKSC